MSPALFPTFSPTIVPTKPTFYPISTPTSVYTNATEILFVVEQQVINTTVAILSGPVETNLFSDAVMHVLRPNSDSDSNSASNQGVRLKNINVHKGPTKDVHNGPWRGLMSFPTSRLRKLTGTSSHLSPMASVAYINYTVSYIIQDMSTTPQNMYDTLIGKLNTAIMETTDFTDYLKSHAHGTELVNASSYYFVVSPYDVVYLRSPKQQRPSLGPTVTPESLTSLVSSNGKGTTMNYMIIGICVAAVAVLCCCFGVYYYRRRQQQKSEAAFLEWTSREDTSSNVKNIKAQRAVEAAAAAAAAAASQPRKSFSIWGRPSAAESRKTMVDTSATPEYDDNLDRNSFFVSANPFGRTSFSLKALRKASEKYSANKVTPSSSSQEQQKKAKQEEEDTNVPTTENPLQSASYRKSQAAPTSRFSEAPIDLATIQNVPFSGP